MSACSRVWCPTYRSIAQPPAIHHGIESGANTSRVSSNDSGCHGRLVNERQVLRGLVAVRFDVENGTEVVGGARPVARQVPYVVRLAARKHELRRALTRCYRGATCGIVNREAELFDHLAEVAAAIRD